MTTFSTTTTMTTPTLVTPPAARRARRRHATRLLALLVPLLLLAACAHVSPILDFDLELFTARVDSTLKTGISLAEAKKIVKASLPPPAMATQLAPVIQSGTTQLEGKRFMYGWNTTTPDKNLSVTLFVDHEGNVVRWTVGAIYGSL